MEELRRRLIKNVPSSLYHYTDANAFLGIIQNHEMWASCIRFMNDYKEYTIAKELLVKKLTIFVQENFRKGAKTIEETLKEIDSIENSIDMFIISFSEKKDDIDQWRAYGKSIPNYSLSFHTKKICKSADILIDQEQIFDRIKTYVYSDNKYPPVSKIMMPCIYDSKIQEDLISEILQDSYEYITTNKKSYEDFITSVIKRFVYYAPIIKNKDYVSEKEWRIIVLFDEERQKIEQLESDKKDLNDELIDFDKKYEKIDYRSNGSYFIPFFKLDFIDLDCIDKVYIGACPDYKTIYESVKFLLQKKGMDVYNKDIIQKSKIAYRNW